MIFTMPNGDVYCLEVASSIPDTLMNIVHVMSWECSSVLAGLFNNSDFCVISMSHIFGL